MRDALTVFDKAIQLHPHFAILYNNRGNVLKHLGKFQESLEDYKKAVQYKPDFTEAYHNLSMAKSYTPWNPFLQKMESLYTKASSAKDRKHLCFALAKAHEDLENFAKSFTYLQEGNRLRKEELAYTLDKDQKIMATVRKYFEAEYPGTLPTASTQEESTLTPIFIVGMPRSGTSLVEQILASHNTVYGAGELNTMNNLVPALLTRYQNPKKNPNNQRTFHQEIEHLHDTYLNALNSLNVSEPMITDKMPVNFFWIGFILSAFPKAKIIHVSRDARATCWSNYKYYFSNNGNGYAYDMIDIAKFYTLYCDHMKFWHTLFPDAIYTLNYEKLTENQQEETAKLLSFCNLQWEDQCLDFHKTERAIQTASDVQVRKKMYTGSSEKWRRYASYMQPMLEIIDEYREP